MAGRWQPVELLLFYLFRWVLEVGRLVQRVPLPVEPSTASYPFFFETGSLFDLELVK